MIYSVAIPDNRFRYYEGPGEFPATGRYRAPRGRPINGIFPPERFLPLLPTDVVATGEGDVARGLLSVADGSTLGGLLSDLTKNVGGKVAATLLAGWIVRKLTRKKRRSK